MPMTMEEYTYLRETMEQVQWLASLVAKQAQSEETAPVPGNALPVLLTALGRACDDAIALGRGHCGGASASEDFFVNEKRGPATDSWAGPPD